MPRGMTASARLGVVGSPPTGARSRPTPQARTAMSDTAVDRTDNDLARFQFSCPAWWTAFNRGRLAERRSAVNERADWREGDFQRGAAGKILGGVETGTRSVSEKIGRRSGRERVG